MGDGRARRCGGSPRRRTTAAWCTTRPRRRASPCSSRGRRAGRATPGRQCPGWSRLVGSRWWGRLLRSTATCGRRLASRPTLRVPRTSGPALSLVAPRVAEEGVDLSGPPPPSSSLGPPRSSPSPWCSPSARPLQASRRGPRARGGRRGRRGRGPCSLEHRVSVDTVAHERGDGGRLLLLVVALAERAEPADEEAAHGGSEVEGKRKSDTARAIKPGSITRP